MEGTHRPTWEYYLSYCEGAFRERHIGDMQLVLTKQRAGVPLTQVALHTISDFPM